MADVKWIKITTDIFDEKILLIEMNECPPALETLQGTFQDFFHRIC